MRSRRLAALAVGVAVLAVGGCGLPEQVAGVRSVPSASPTGAPLDVVTATSVATRVLTAATSAAALRGPAGDTARAAVLTGDALAVANAAARNAKGTPPAAPPSAPRPQIVTMSRGAGWPRYIVATTLDTGTDTRWLHVLVSASATTLFRLTENVRMIAGAALPGLGAPSSGVVADGVGGTDASARDVLAALAAGLAYPHPTLSDLVATTDPASSALRANAARQQQGLGSLATLTSRQTPAGPPTAFATPSGGTLVFGLLTRTDTITLKPSATALNVPADVAKLIGKAKVSRFVTVTTLEPVCLSVPAAAAATLVGFDEQVLRAAGA